MRVRVLPRATASAVLTSAIANAGRAVAAATILLTIPLLVETFILRDRVGQLPIPLLLLLVILSGIVVVILRPRTGIVLACLVVAGAATVGYQVALLAPDPGLFEGGTFVINRPTIALVLVGMASTTALAGISWAVLGYGVSVAAGLLGASIAGVPFRPGLGPTLVLALAVIAYLTLATIQYGLRRRVPNFDQLEAETYTLARGEDLARRSTAVVHDTVLNDLAVIMNAPDRLDERARDRLRADLETLRGEAWLGDSAGPASMSDDEAGLRNEVMRVVSEFQWKGLSIHVTGATDRDHGVPPEVGAALVGAIRACLENVVRHSGATTAEVEVIPDDTSVTVMITDHGRGFDPADVAGDRLGLRTSVMERMEAVGGAVRIWSRPGAGTSIVITAPAGAAEGAA